MATIRDVAKLAGVSMSTVSRTLSGKIFVEEKTREKVLEAVEKLHYRPNLLARGLRAGSTGSIAFLVPDIDSLFYFYKHILEQVLILVIQLYESSTHYLFKCQFICLK